MNSTVSGNLKPVEVSGEAVKELTRYIRNWSGIDDATIRLTKPEVSQYGMFDGDKTFTLNIDELSLNPNRMLLTVTPFRLRQEAVLTGTMLHEAGHARFSKWRVPNMVHIDKTPVAEQTMALARLMEEPRVEALMATRVAPDLSWTMRATAAHLIPMTTLSNDPNQQVMDVITSWALRAGREIALVQHQGGSFRVWVRQFNALLEDVLTAHFERLNSTDPLGRARLVFNELCGMLKQTLTRGPALVEIARYILDLLFPETPQDQMPMAGGGCLEQGQEDQSDEGEQGEGNSDPEDEGSGDDPGAGDSGQEDEDGESDEGATESSTSDLTDLLKQIEKLADKDIQQQTQKDSKESASSGAASGQTEPGVYKDWRDPDKSERDQAKQAERFLRGLIAPTESSKVTLTDSPSATVDGAALAAWKAGGQLTDPTFFKRTHRNVEPNPPVKIAILVDISMSMTELQKPSAVLSWALANAALDLRNFAGRGQQIESCMIHWGTSVKVVQRRGETVPGIREVPCIEGTSMMARALAEVENQLPGFFDITEDPANRLLIQFTDWDLSYDSVSESVEATCRALESGVNMLTIAPKHYNSTVLSAVAKNCYGPGQSAVMKYNPMFPDQVWEQAAEALSL